MKKIEVQGLGVYIEIYKRKEQLTDLETMKEAEKAIRREVMRREQCTNPSTSHSDNYNDI